MIVPAKKIVVHPNFNLTLLTHNVALIELDGDLDLQVAANIDLAASVSALDLVNLDLSVSVRHCAKQIGRAKLERRGRHCELSMPLAKRYSGVTSIRETSIIR